jgi:protoheme IX farnesyltransferase
MSTVRTALQPVLTRPMAYLTLGKPDVTFLVVITTALGYCIGVRGPMDSHVLFHVVLGTTLISAGTSALNQVVERDMDAVMRRTASRPIPLGILPPSEALFFGITMVAGGAVYLLALVNAMACFLAMASCAVYLAAYTPLKTRTPWATFVGAFPGAVPPLIGWAAARGSVEGSAWLLFAILFLWQFPHFLAIAWMYREDYARAGIRMLPVVDPSGALTFRLIVGYAAALVPVSLLVAVVGLAGVRYFFGATVLGLMLLQICLWAARERTNSSAKWLMHATVIHLPLLLALMLYDKLPQ